LVLEVAGAGDVLLELRRAGVEDVAGAAERHTQLLGGGDLGVSGAAEADHGGAGGERLGADVAGAGGLDLELVALPVEVDVARAGELHEQALVLEAVDAQVGRACDGDDL